MERHEWWKWRTKVFSKHGMCLLLDNLDRVACIQPGKAVPNAFAFSYHEAEHSKCRHQPNTGGVRPVGMVVTMDPLAPFPSSLTLHVSTHTMYQMMVHGAGPRGQEPVYGRNLGAQ